MSKNKRAVSLVISYVLLIVLSLSLAVYVFNWLKDFVPKEDVKCPEGISLVIRDSLQSGTDLTLTVQNRGRFNADGYFIRVNNETEPNFGVYLLNRTGIPMLVGEENTTTFNVTNYLEGTDSYPMVGTFKVIEIQPFIWVPKHAGPVLCEDISRINK